MPEGYSFLCAWVLRSPFSYPAQASVCVEVVSAFSFFLGGHVSPFTFSVTAEKDLINLPFFQILGRPSFPFFFFIFHANTKSLQFRSDTLEAFPRECLPPLNFRK